jgi:hypothetical protein
VNGDGYSDVIVGAPLYDNDQVDEGRAYLYLGSASGLSTSSWIADGDQAGASFGVEVGTAGDVNGDGYSDVIAGAYLFDNGQLNEGRAHVYHGAAAGLAATAAWTAEPDQIDTYFGVSATAGDVNGDGFSDVIVGAGGYDNGETDEGRAFVYYGSASGLSTTPAWTAESNRANAYFGWSVATAGDVNGDGFSDVIVGAFRYSNGETDEGGAFVYHGSAAGLAATPAWTAESNQAGAEFGTGVRTAGDVNGDGYSDVIVGAYLFDNGETNEGRVFVYHGSAAGLAPTASWTQESNQAYAYFGSRSVGTAGDVNGDGYSDVIVGASGYDNGETDEGRAFVYHGSAAGLAPTASWTAESNQADAALGISVATAGDVNSDGFSDVIVGAPSFDNGETSEGRVFVYHGSAAGLAPTASWTVESNHASASFGWSVATAGDVNADGFSDVIVGAHYYETYEGRAFAYHGSAAGLATTPAWTAESNQANAYFGSSVRTAGDVNGDGFSDVIVAGGGRAFVYYGNNGGGLDRSPRQVRTDDSAPIWVLGNSDSETAFRLKALGRTAAGRGRVRVQLEVKPAGVPFDGTGLATGPAADTGTPGGAGSAVPLSQLAGSLAPETLYHWRLRIACDSPFFPRSPWLTLPYNGRSEADVRTAGMTTAVSEGTGSPRAVQLGPGAPNPFRSATEFTYWLPQHGRHRLAVYDVQGREVAVLAEGMQLAGRRTLRWDGRDGRGAELPSGVYFLRLESAGRMEAQKVVIAR